MTSSYFCSGCRRSRETAPLLHPRRPHIRAAAAHWPRRLRHPRRGTGHSQHQQGRGAFHCGRNCDQLHAHRAAGEVWAAHHAGPCSAPCRAMQRTIARLCRAKPEQVIWCHARSPVSRGGGRGMECETVSAMRHAPISPLPFLHACRRRLLHSLRSTATFSSNPMSRSSDRSSSPSHLGCSRSCHPTRSRPCSTAPLGWSM